MELAGPVPELITGSEVPETDPHLPDFARLGEQIYYYTPPPPSNEIKEIVTLDPDLIIICSWMYAFSKHIVKYTQNYKMIYPSSPILLLKQDGGDFFYRTNAQQMKNLSPAISTICQLTGQKSGRGKLKILMHVFSNGGAWTACQLSDAYTALHRNTLSPGVLPISALILDSTPSLPDPKASHTAICEALPKSPAMLNSLGSKAVWTFISLTRALDILTGAEHLTLNIRRRLNDPAGPFIQHDQPRLYIYSQGDALIPAAAIEAHAQDARDIIGKGNLEEMVQLEDFGTTRHVSHMLGDPRRYWGLVEKVWKQSME